MQKDIVYCNSGIVVQEKIFYDDRRQTIIETKV